MNLLSTVSTILFLSPSPSSNHTSFILDLIFVCRSHAGPSLFFLLVVISSAHFWVSVFPFYLLSRAILMFLMTENARSFCSAAISFHITFPRLLKASF
jgi:hypothetical protein